MVSFAMKLNFDEFKHNVQELNELSIYKEVGAFLKYSITLPHNALTPFSYAIEQRI